MNATSARVGLDPIQMLWVRGSLSRMELLCVRSFLAHGHPVELYTYEPPDNLPAGVQVADASAIVPTAEAPASPGAPFTAGTMGSFSDYFRYRLLLAKGGWWADMDVVCLRPWSFPAHALTASTDELQAGSVANGFVLRFPPRHPVMTACLDALRGLDLRRIGIDRTGPLLLHQVLSSQGRLGLMQPAPVFAPVPWNASIQLILPFWRRFTIGMMKNRLRRPHLLPRFTRDTVAVHLWNETWRHAGRDKQATYSRFSLYERLQRRYNPPTP